MTQDLGDFIVPAPRTKDDVERLGRRLRDTLQQQDALQARKAAAIARLNDRYDIDIKKAEEQASALTDAIINFAAANKKMLTSTQTVELRSITIAWKVDGTGSLVFTQPEAAVVARLEKIGETDFVEIKKSVKKGPLKANRALLARLKNMVTVNFSDTITVTTKPTRAQAQRGVKRFSRSKAL